MVPMSPRLASASTSTPLARSSAMVRSSTANPAEPYVSEERHLGFDDREAGEGGHAHVTERGQAVRIGGQPHAASSSGCGSIPGHKAARARRRRPPAGNRNPSTATGPGRDAVPAATARRCRRGCRPRCPAPPPRRPAPSSRMECSSAHSGRTDLQPSMRGPELPYGVLITMSTSPARMASNAEMAGRSGLGSSKCLRTTSTGIPLRRNISCGAVGGQHPEAEIGQALDREHQRPLVPVGHRHEDRPRRGQRP